LLAPQPDADGSAAEQAMAEVAGDDDGEAEMAFSPFVCEWSDDNKARFVQLFRCAPGRLPAPSQRLLLNAHRAAAADLAMCLDNCVSGVPPITSDVKAFLHAAAAFTDRDGAVWAVKDAVVQGDASLTKYLAVLADLHMRAVATLAKMPEVDGVAPPMPAKQVLLAVRAAAQEVMRVVDLLNTGDGSGGGDGGQPEDSVDGGGAEVRVGGDQTPARDAAGGSSGGAHAADDEVARAITTAQERSMALTSAQRDQLQVLQRFARDWKQAGSEGMAMMAAPQHVGTFGSTPPFVRVTFMHFALEQALKVRKLLTKKWAQQLGEVDDIQLAMKYEGAVGLMMMTQPVTIKKMADKATVLCSKYDIMKYNSSVVSQLRPHVHPSARACLQEFLNSLETLAFSLDVADRADRLSGHLSRHAQAQAAFLFQCGVAFMWSEAYGRRLYCPIDRMTMLDPTFRDRFSGIADALVEWRESFDPDPSIVKQATFVAVMNRITSRSATRRCQMKGHTHKFVDCPLFVQAVSKLLAKLPAPDGGW